MEDRLLAILDDDSIYTEVIKSNLKERRIIINQEISDDLLESVVMMIIRWNTEDKHIENPKNRRKIIIYLNSDGGDVIMGSQLLSAIKYSKTPVVTVGFAKCASMCSYLLAAGSERYCFPNTVVLYHDGQTGYVSSGNKGKDIQKFYDKLDERMIQFMVENTKMTTEFIEEIKDREFYMFAEEAKERGIVDYIIGIDCDIDAIL
jgi:ATP-dependent Clp protease protease subunit